MTFYLRLICLIAILFPVQVSADDHLEAEVITWWVSGGERAALQILIDAYQDKGHTWIDTPVESSYYAKTAAITRILNDNPPTAVQWQAGVSLKQVFKEGLFRNIDEVARNENWKEVLPAAIWENITVNGSIIAAPMTLHGSNWLWANKKILDEVGAEVPTNWDDFMVQATKIQDAGYIPLALGGQAWQERALFLPVVLGTGGIDFYEAALVHHLPEALSSPKMIKSFEVFRKLQKFVDSESKDRNWSTTTKLVIDGKAAFQIIGDWAKGEFIQAGQIAEKDFICTLSPGSNEAYLMVSDTLAMGNGSDPLFLKGQTELARTIMAPEVQRKLNLLKGSIPPRTDVSMDGFDYCSKLAMATVSKKDSAYPGFNMANTGLVASSIMNVISAFWNDPEITAEQATQMLADAVAESLL